MKIIAIETSRRAIFHLVSRKINISIYSCGNNVLKRLHSFSLYTLHPSAPTNELTLNAPSDLQTEKEKKYIERCVEEK